MIQHSHVPQRQRRRIARQRLLDQFARIDRCLGHSAADQFGVFDQPVLRIEHHHRKHLVLKRPQLDPQEVAHHLRRRQHLASLQLLRGLRHLARIGRQ